jgi:hypothetical protein
MEYKVTLIQTFMYDTIINTNSKRKAGLDALIKAGKDINALDHADSDGWEVYEVNKNEDES